MNFEALGTCLYGIACRFSKSHTNEDYSQVTKDPDPNYRPTLNGNSISIQISIRKREYDFKLAEDVSLS